MIDNIEDISFAIQNKGDQDFIAVDYQVSNQKEETSDFRFKVPSRDVIVRNSAYVVPMGRPVIFYADFTDFVAGNTDFIPLGENGAFSTTVSASNQQISADNKIEVNAVNTLIDSQGLGYDHGLLMKDSPKIKAVYHNTTLEKTEPLQSDQGEYQLGVVSRAMLNGLMVLIAFIAAFFSIAAIVLYYLVKLVREVNYLREEALYEED